MVREGVFTNWDGSLTCTPSRYCQADSEEEIVEVVRAAQTPIRAVGAGHSWSPLVLTEGTLLNLDKLNKLVHVDREKMRVTVQAGIRLHDLIDLVDGFGLALKNLGAITQQSIAGATATGTHGSGVKFGSLHTQIVGMKIVMADGSIRTFLEGRDDEWLRAGRMSLGLLGVVSEVTLQCIPAHNLELKAWKADFDETLALLPQLVADNDHVRFYWFPGSENLYVNTMNETDKPRTPHNPVVSWVRNVFMRQYVMGALWQMGELFPSEVHQLNAFEERTGFTRDDDVGASAAELTTPMPPPHIETEYAVDLPRAQEALLAYRKMVVDMELNVNVPAEIRFVGSDDAYLSPANGKDICYIAAYVRGENLAKPFIPAFEEMIKPFGGRTHWGKRFAMSREEAKRLYPGFEQFSAIRREADPTGKFMNPFLAEYFA